MKGGMTKVWRIALHDYLRHVRTKRFVLALLSAPLILLVMVGLVFLVLSMQINTTPLGYVDHSGLLADPVPGPEVKPPDKPVPMVAFSDEDSARAALDAGQIQGYYVLPADYLQTGQAQLVQYAPVKQFARGQFEDLLSANLLKNTDPAVAARLIKGASLTVESADGQRSTSSGDWFSVLLPYIAGIIFMITMFISGGYLMQAVVDEKENRTMEVMLTSVSPDQFMAGKIIGNTAVGLTQLVTWLGMLALTILVGRQYVDFLGGIRLTAQSVLLFVFVLLPSFIALAALMAAVGSTVTEAREGQQITGLLSLPVWIPYMLTFVLIGNPNSTLAIVLSMLPLTAPLSILMRDGVTILPAWQIALSSLIQILSAVAAIWLAGRAFRLGMLRYGKRLQWREIFRRQPA